MMPPRTCTVGPIALSVVHELDPSVALEPRVERSRELLVRPWSRGDREKLESVAFGERDACVPDRAVGRPAPDRIRSR